MKKYMKKSELLEEYGSVWRICEYDMIDYLDELIELSKKYGMDYEHITEDDGLRDKDKVRYLGDEVLYTIRQLIIGEEDELVQIRI